MGIGIFVLEIIIRIVLFLKRKYCPNSINPPVFKVSSNKELKSIQVNIPEFTKFQGNTQNLDDRRQVISGEGENQENTQKEEPKVESEACANENMTYIAEQNVSSNSCIINVTEQDNHTSGIKVEREDCKSKLPEESKLPSNLIPVPVKSVIDSKSELKASRNKSYGPKEQLSYSFVIVYILASFIASILNILRLVVHTEQGKMLLINSIVTITRTILYVLPVLWLYCHEEAWQYSQHKIRQLKTNLIHIS